MIQSMKYKKLKIVKTVFIAAMLAMQMIMQHSDGVRHLQGVYMVRQCQTPSYVLRPMAAGEGRKAGEIDPLALAKEIVADLEAPDQPITEQDIRMLANLYYWSLHGLPKELKMIRLGLFPQAPYRNLPCYVYDLNDMKVASFGNEGIIDKQMAELIEFINADPAQRRDPRSYRFIKWSIMDEGNWALDMRDPAIHAAMTHWIFHQVIHPFKDANTHTGWALMNILRKKAGLAAIDFPKTRESHQEYLRTFNQDRNPFPFMEYIKCLAQSTGYGPASKAGPVPLGHLGPVPEQSVLRPMAYDEKIGLDSEQLIEEIINKMGIELETSGGKPLTCRDIINTIRDCLEISLLPPRSLDKPALQRLPVNMRRAGSRERSEALIALREAYSGDFNKSAFALRDISSPAFRLLLDVIDTKGIMNTSYLWRYQFELERLKAVAKGMIAARYRPDSDVMLNIFVPAVSKGHELACVTSVVIEAAQEVMGDAWRRHLKLKLIGIDINAHSIEIAKLKLSGKFTKEEVPRRGGATLREKARAASRVNRHFREMNRINKRSLAAGRAASFKIELKAMNSLDDEALKYFREADIVSLNFLFMYLSEEARLRLISSLTQMKPGAALFTDITVPYLKMCIQNGRCSNEAWQLMRRYFVWSKGDVTEEEMAVTKRFGKSGDVSQGASSQLEDLRIRDDSEHEI